MRSIFVLSVVVGVGVIAACGADAVSIFPGGGDAGAGGDGSNGDKGYDFDDRDGSSDDEGTKGQPLQITPLDAVIDVVNGVAAPVRYQATVGGVKVAAAFIVDRGEIGTFDASGSFTASGRLGGKAKVIANYGSKSASTGLTVKLHVTQNGAPVGVDAGGGGSGGAGGVGGEGVGGPTSDPGNVQLLKGTPVADPGLAFLYPYDKTIFPRGILPPLLQWKPGAKVYDAVSIEIKETYFDYQGFFAKTATPFLHHPVPKEAWDQMAYSNGGEDVSVTLKFTSGGVTYGPLTETWKIAQGTLKGTLYYNSYDSKLASNGAVLAVRGDSTDPTLIAGSSGDESKCRVCHTVSNNGSTMLAVRGDNKYKKGSVYDLTKANKETLKPEADYRYTWPALYPDGSIAVTSENSAAIWASFIGPSKVIALPSGDAVTVKNFPADLIANMASFSADGKQFTFVVDRGTVNSVAVPAGTIMTMSFDKATMSFGPATKLYTAAADRGPGWPLFLPTGNALVFSLDYGRGDASQASPGFYNVGRTNVLPSELWWIDKATGVAKPLAIANGAGNVSAADQQKNYQPTINPIISGGYAWMVFTSRRAYGNANPPSLKKLWVSAIDLNAPSGSDPSHPAFYLPAQEFASGNSRGFSVLDPCKVDGAGPCSSGDECCGGYCRPGADGKGLVCTAQVPACAQEFEKCTKVSDCCGATEGIQCIAGRCSAPEPPKIK